MKRICRPGSQRYLDIPPEKEHEYTHLSPIRFDRDHQLKLIMKLSFDYYSRDDTRSFFCDYFSIVIQLKDGRYARYHSNKICIYKIDFQLKRCECEITQKTEKVYSFDEINDNILGLVGNKGINIVKCTKNEIQLIHSINDTCKVQIFSLNDNRFGLYNETQIFIYQSVTPYKQINKMTVTEPMKIERILHLKKKPNYLLVYVTSISEGHNIYLYDLISYQRISVVWRGIIGEMLELQNGHLLIGDEYHGSSLVVMELDKFTIVTKLEGLFFKLFTEGNLYLYDSNSFLYNNGDLVLISFVNGKYELKDQVYMPDVTCLKDNKTGLSYIIKENSVFRFDDQ